MTTIVCSCCGDGIEDNATENVWHGHSPYPGDHGTGLCRGCGGDPDATEARARLGFALCTFVDARVPFLARRLSEENRKRFLALPYEEQANAVVRLVARGVLA